MDALKKPPSSLILFGLGFMWGFVGTYIGIKEDGASDSNGEFLLISIAVQILIGFILGRIGITCLRFVAIAKPEHMLRFVVTFIGITTGCQLAQILFISFWSVAQLLAFMVTIGYGYQQTILSIRKQQSSPK